MQRRSLSQLELLRLVHRGDMLSHRPTRAGPGVTRLEQSGRPAHASWLASGPGSVEARAQVTASALMRALACDGTIAAMLMLVSLEDPLLEAERGVGSAYGLVGSAAEDSTGFRELCTG